MFDDAEDVFTLIFSAIGAASMCWERVDRAGVFDSDKAKAIGDATMIRLSELIGGF